ncbi:Uncharacterized protein C9orf135-like protein [Trichoplax sp. H2]|nr:Uncharacterized protein C9orf135-like protein [Trichoplax sp. H2]|eukprot:RDD46156.1 Uncharacterized protein C9orf135-like protein [Trichoplax sp. H2]
MDECSTRKKFTDQVRLSHNERKGTCLLRSDHLNYRNGILTSTWDQSKESYPRDYDVSQEQRPNMHKSTYNRLSNITDGSFPLTTHQESTAQINLKNRYSEKNIKQSLVQDQVYGPEIKNRNNETFLANYKNVLPQHGKEHGKRYLETTYTKDFARSVESKPKAETQGKAENDSSYRRVMSHFTDVDNHRKKGINTWQDESVSSVDTSAKAKLHRSCIFDSS